MQRLQRDEAEKELVRVVRSPEGEVSLDLTGRKPGRGAYVCRSADCLKKAIKSHRFEREFNCEIPQKVYDLLERRWTKVENDKALSMLGICRRAGKLSCGHDAAQTAIKHGHARLCLLSSDASERLCEEFERACSSEGRSVPLIKTGYTMQEIGHATSLRSAVLTVDDQGLASRIQTILNIAYGEDNV